MNSSQVAEAVAVVAVLVAALVLTVAQWRVLARPEPRTRAYVIAWLVSVSAIAGFRSLMDYMVGNSTTERVLLNVTWMAAPCALSLFFASRFMRPAPRGPRQLLVLFVFHAVMMAIVSYI